MNNQEFMTIIQNQRIWREEFKMQKCRERKYKLLIMSKYKSRGNKSASYIEARLPLVQQELDDLNNPLEGGKNTIFDIFL